MSPSLQLCKAKRSVTAAFAGLRAQGNNRGPQSESYTETAAEGYAILAISCAFCKLPPGGRQAPQGSQAKTPFFAQRALSAAQEVRPKGMR